LQIEEDEDDDVSVHLEWRRLASWVKTARRPRHCQMLLMWQRHWHCQSTTQRNM